MFAPVARQGGFKVFAANLGQTVTLDDVKAEGNSRAVRRCRRSMPTRAKSSVTLHALSLRSQWIYTHDS